MSFNSISIQDKVFNTEPLLNDNEYDIIKEYMQKNFLIIKYLKKLVQKL